MKPNYRLDQIGSLTRPAPLLDARDAYAAGKIGLTELRQAEDEAILAALRMQKKVGQNIFTDGEFRRDCWQTNFMQAVDGFEGEYPERKVTLPDGTRTTIKMHSKVVEGPLVVRQRLAQVDAAFLAKYAPGPYKITLPSPSFIAFMGFRNGVTERAYRTPDDLHQRMVEIMRNELVALAADGVAYIQLDEGFTRYAHDGIRQQLINTGADLEALLAKDIAADNACYDAVRDKVIVGMHLCRGSRASWDRGTGTYDWLAERLFNALRVDRFLLEYDSQRVGGFEPLRFLPKGKIAVLGIIDSTNPKLENRDELLRRLDAACKYCSPDQLAISTQCGFQAAADRDGAHMTEDQQWHKLELLAEVGRAFFE
jgi:5-methyltetrahydropteroyltriglutamate--homocysteine methyltransferase